MLRLLGEQIIRQAGSGGPEDAVITQQKTGGGVGKNDLALADAQDAILAQLEKGAEFALIRFDIVHGSSLPRFHSGFALPMIPNFGDAYNALLLKI